MAEKNFVTELTAQNANETIKTLISTYTVPQGVSRLVEVGAVCSGSGMTTLEDVAFILELESDDSSSWGGTQQFASDVVKVVSNGAVVFPARVHDVNIPVQPGSHIKFSTTFNHALTVNPSVRAFGKFV